VQEVAGHLEKGARPVADATADALQAQAEGVAAGAGAMGDKAEEGVKELAGKAKEVARPTADAAEEAVDAQVRHC
jgi:hypothetical protein